MRANLNFFDSKKNKPLALIDETAEAVFSSVACVIVGDLKIKRSCTISTKRNITGSVKAKGKARSSATSLFGHGVVPSIDGITFNIGSMRLFVNRTRKR